MRLGDVRCNVRLWTREGQATMHRICPKSMKVETGQVVIGHCKGYRLQNLRAFGTTQGQLSVRSIVKQIWVRCTPNDVVLPAAP